MLINRHKNIFFTLLVLIATFALSVSVRVNNLSKPMGRHHESVTAHILCTDYRFYTEGASKFYFSPVINFNSGAEQKCAKYYLMRDSENNFYYYSYPPFAFLFPYFIFKSLCIEPNVFGIRTISLLIHLICSLLVFKLVLSFFNKSIKDKFYFPAYIGYVLYIFATGNLWFHSQVYFSDMLLQPIILALMLMCLNIFKNTILRKRAFYVLLFVLSFIAVYTEYLALFFLFFASLFFIVESITKKQKHFLYSTLIIAFASVSSLTLTIFQYSKISSLEYLKRALVERYTVRSGHSDLAQNAITIKDSISIDIISEHYEENYGYLLDVCWGILIILCVLILINKSAVLEYLKKGTFKVWAICFLAYITHMLAFFNFNMIHDFGTLKSTLLTIPFAAFGSGVVYEIIVNNSAFFKKLYYLAASITLITFIHFSLNKYYLANDYSTAYKFVTEIPELTKKYGSSDVVISSNSYFTYETSFYSKRRIEAIANLYELRNMLIFCDIKEGLFFERTSDRYNIYKINQKGDTLFQATEALTNK